MAVCFFLSFFIIINIIIIVNTAPYITLWICWKVSFACDFPLQVIWLGRVVWNKHDLRFLFLEDNTVNI